MSDHDKCVLVGWGVGIFAIILMIFGPIVTISSPPRLPSKAQIKAWSKIVDRIERQHRP